MTHHVCSRSLAVLFPVNMNNRGQNVVEVQETFHKLRRASDQIQFVAYHYRPSGNFLFVDTDQETQQLALEVGERFIGLRCVVRTLSELQEVSETAPPVTEVTPGGSVVVVTPMGPRKLIYVALSDSVPASGRSIGQIGSRIGILRWPSSRDLLCLYDRQPSSGDVGQVTRGVVQHFRRNLDMPHLYGTGRAFSVIKDLLTGHGLGEEEN